MKPSTHQPTTHSNCRPHHKSSVDRMRWSRHLLRWCGVVMASMVVMLSVGCTPDITCEQIGCAFGQTCNVTTGQCETPSIDCRQNASLCQSNETCDTATGRCLSTQVSCINQRACPLGQVCNAETGICQNVGNCRSAQDCDSNEVCNLDSGQCAPKPCENSSACGDGFVCDAERCVSGCDDDTPCPAEALCRQEPDQRVGQCITSCAKDTDCNFGRYCNILNTPPTCDPEPPCERDDNCRSDEVCRNFLCVRPPCTSNTECNEDQVCNASSGICVGGNCIEDAFSPNHTSSQAQPLPQGTTVQLNHCPGRPDWYRLEVNRDEFIQIQLEHAATQDLDIILYNELLQPLSQDQQLSTLARVAYQATTSQVLFLKVTTSSFTSSSYSITVNRRQGGVCVDDDLEDNDTQETATPLNIMADDVISVPTRVCQTDVDWYDLGTFDAQAGLTMSVSPVDGIDINASLYTPDGDIITVPETLSLLRLGAAGSYFLRVQSARAKSSDVRLNLSARGEYSCPDVEFNGEPETASPLNVNTLETLVLCPLQDSWELDWYQISAPTQPSVLTFKIARPTSELPIKPSQVQATLFEVVADTPPRPIRQASSQQDGTQTIAAVVQPDRSYLVRITSNEPPGRLWQTPVYQIVYQYAPVP